MRLDPTNDPNRRPAVFTSTFQEITSAVILTLAPALGSMNVSGLVIALPYISDTFGVTGGQLSWTLSAASLGTGSFLLLGGQLSDVFGRKKVLIASYALYSVVSLIAGFMHNVIAFFVLRALQGMFTASAVTSAVGIMGSTYSHGKRRNYFLATFSSGAPIGFVMGIVTSGICSQLLSWRAVLWFYTIIFALIAIAAIFTVPNDPPLDWQSAKLRLKEIDLGGTALTVSGFTLFVFSLSQAEAAPEGWGTPYIIALLIAGVVLIAGFCVYEAYIPKHPLMPIEIWLYPGFALSMVIIALGWIDFTGVLTYYATLYFQQVHFASPLLTTAYFIPMAVGGVLVNVFAAMTLHRIPGRVLIIIANLGFTGAALCWSFADENTLYWALPFPALILCVIGADLAYNVCNLHALSSVDSSLQSTAGGVFNTVLQLSTAIGLASSSAVVTSVTPDVTNASVKDKVKGYHAGFYFALAAGAIALILSVFLRVGVQGEVKKVTDEDEES